MKTIHMLERFEWNQLLKGRLVDITDGLAIGVSPDALDGSRELPTKKSPRRRMRRDTRLDKKQQFFSRHFTEHGEKSKCRHCKKVFRGKYHRLAAMTHLRRTHKDVWRKR